MRMKVENLKRCPELLDAMSLISKNIKSFDNACFSTIKIAFDNCGGGCTYASFKIRKNSKLGESIQGLIQDSLLEERAKLTKEIKSL
jgi:hypothetical protein